MAAAHGCVLRRGRHTCRWCCGHDGIGTGIIFTAETVGLLLSSLGAGRLAQRFAQKRLILAGFVLIIGGMLLLIVMVSDDSSVWAFAPGLFLVGGGLGAMLTASVNLVQCSFVESQQGEISGHSRSVSNLGSSLGVRDRRNRPRRRHRNHPGTVLRAGHGRARGVRRDRVYRGDDAAQDHHTRDEPQPLSAG